MKDYSIRQNKISRLIQRELSSILQTECASSYPGTLITVTVVRVSPDLSFAKVYLSIFPNSKNEEIMSSVKTSTKNTRHLLAQKIRHQVKKIPEIAFFPDDSIDYFDNINNLLNNEDK